MGTPLLAGRDFNERDTATSPMVAIVNESFAREFAGGANPIGRRFFKKAAIQPQVEYEIVGLVKDAKYEGIREPFAPIYYAPMAQGESPDTQDQILIRSHIPLADLTSRVKQTIAQVNPDISIRFQSMQSMIHDWLLGDRLMATLSGFFGFLAALLATVGLYGVMSYMVVRRTNEIGIRMTLGAGRGEIVGMMVREAGVLLAAGLAGGVALSLAGGRAAGSMLFGLKPYDPVTLALAAVLLSLVAVAASYLPARRATRVDPMIALRYE
jgi:putative ABC transport system permease protein